MQRLQIFNGLNINLDCGSGSSDYESHNLIVMLPYLYEALFSVAREIATMSQPAVPV